jgi:hypothetical protein
MAMFQINLRPGKCLKNTPVGEYTVKQIRLKEANSFMQQALLQAGFLFAILFFCSWL